MLYEKQLLFLCLADLVIHEKMDCMGDQDATPCTDLCQCVYTHQGGSSLGLWYCSAHGDETLNLLPFTWSTIQTWLMVGKSLRGKSLEQLILDLEAVSVHYSSPTPHSAPGRY